MSIQFKSLAAAAVLVFAGTAQAALIDRGGGMIYDDVLKITWLSDWNYAQTSNFAADGRMSWSTAMTWADNLEFGGYSDWRLPTRDLSCRNFCTGGEMGFMYYQNIGAQLGHPDGIFSGSNTANLALFTNVTRSGYWAGPDCTVPGVCAVFNMAYGAESWTPGGGFLALAVRPGDVTAAIPEPETYALMIAGLAAVGVAASRRRA